MISMYLIKKYLGVSSFQANPSQIDVENNEILLAHCTVPLDMLTKYNLDTHFESNLGVAIQGELKHKGVYIFKLSNNLKDYILLKGDITKTPFLNKLCRTQVKIKLDQDSSVRYFLTKPLGNHHIIFYEDEIKQDINNLINIIN